MPETLHHLRAWRQRRGFTQEALADRLGTHADVISNLEHSDRSLSSTWLHRIAPALATTPGTILDYAPDDAHLEILRFGA